MVTSGAYRGNYTNKTSFYARWVALGEMCVLKSFGWCVMITDVRDGLIPEFISFINNGVEEWGYIL